jgi:drug/metabolite transporter (DMT)-like permease
MLIKFMLNSNHDQPTPVPPIVILIAGVLSASTSSIFIRFAQEEVHSIVIASYRMAIATVILLPWALTRYRSDLRRLGTRQWAMTLLAGLCLGLHFGTWISSLAFTSVASSVVLVQTTPIFVMLLSPLILGEKPSGRAVVGLFVALLGSLAIGISDSCSSPFEPNCIATLSSANSTALRGDLLALAGALTGALYLLIGRSVRKTIPLIPYITLVYGIAAISLWSVALSIRLPIMGFSSPMYLWFLLLAIFPQLLAHSSYNWALKYLPAMLVSLSLLGEPVSATLLAYLFLGERLSSLRWIGAIIVLAGIALAVIYPKRTLQPAPGIDTIRE